MSEFLGLRYVYPVTEPESEIRRWTARTGSLARKTVVTGAQIWNLTLRLEADKGGAKRAAAKLHAHRTAHQDGTPFMLRMPQLVGNTPPTRTVRASGNLQAGDVSIAVRNTSEGETLIPAGLFFRFGTDPKVYQANEDLLLTGRAASTLRFDPPARLAQAIPVLDFNPMIRVAYVPQPVRFIHNAAKVHLPLIQVEEAV